MSMEEYQERHILAVDRLRGLVAEETVERSICIIFRMWRFSFWSWRMYGARSTGGAWEHYSIEEMRSINEILYSDIVGGHYKTAGPIRHMRRGSSEGEGGF